MTEGQLALALPHVPALRAADFLPHAGARLALEMIAGDKPWPQDRLVLWGGAGAGKTHLLHIWASEHGASLRAGAALDEPFWPDGPVAIDDADQVLSEQALLHVVNAAAESRHRVLLSMTRPPARRRIQLADLASRLRATMAIEIGPQDDAMRAALLAKLLSERQLVVLPSVQSFILTRLPRTAAAILDAVRRLDEAALAAQSAISRALAADCLAPLFVNDPVKETSP